MCMFGAGDFVISTGTSLLVSLLSMVHMYASFVVTYPFAYNLFELHIVY